MGISALSFVYNEGHYMDECLSQLKPYVDEIIIADGSSTDNTVEIARKHGAKVLEFPHLACGDFYKLELHRQAKNDWLLWFYPDERWPKITLDAIKEYVKDPTYTAYSFMRRDYRGDEWLHYNQNGKDIYFGTNDSPNFQNRLHKNNGVIYYTELVHAEYHGQSSVKTCPPEIFMEHRKTKEEQAYDDWRLVVEYQHLIWKYGSPKVEPYLTYITSYRQVMRETMIRVQKNDRILLPQEKDWMNWREIMDE